MLLESPVLDLDTDFPLLLLAVIATSNNGRKIAGAFLTAVKLVPKEKRAELKKCFNFLKTGFW